MHIKQILHGLPLNIKIYSPKASNIWWRESELNIISLRVNKLNIQRKSIKHLLYYIFLFEKTNKVRKYQFNLNIKFLYFHYIFIFAIYRDIARFDGKFQCKQRVEVEYHNLPNLWFNSQGYNKYIVYINI